MSTKSQAKEKAAPNSSREDDDDLAVLIYRESQLRKAEAAAAAAERKKTSKTASSHHRTSTRKRTHVKNHGEESLYIPQRKGATKRKRESSLEEGRPKKEVTKKKYRYECSTDGCTTYAQKGGVCVRHGAKVKLCSSDGCTNRSLKGGVCFRHGTNRKRCSSEGCTNISSREECARGMEHRGNDAVAMDAQILLCREECA